MRRYLTVFLFLWAVPVAAAEVKFDQSYTQQMFRDFSEEVGAAIHYRPIGPAVALGVKGFDLGVEIMATDINENKNYWKKGVENQSPPSYLLNSRIHFLKGLPFGFDVGVALGKVLDPDIPYVGGEARYEILQDKGLRPGLSIRGYYSQTLNVDQLELKAYGVDLSVSKGLGVAIKIIPYAGIGQYWVSSKPQNLTSGLRLDKEEFSTLYGFLGARLKMVLLSVTAQVDYGVVPSFNLQFGFIF